MFPYRRTQRADRRDYPDRSGYYLRGGTLNAINPAGNLRSGRINPPAVYGDRPGDRGGLGGGIVPAGAGEILSVRPIGTLPLRSIPDGRFFRFVPAGTIPAGTIYESRGSGWYDIPGGYAGGPYYLAGDTAVYPV